MEDYQTTMNKFLFYPKVIGSILGLHIFVSIRLGH